MPVLHYDAFHRLLENYARELPRILDRHALTQKLVLRVGQELSQNESPFTVAVVGQMRVGKSSLLNTLVGADLAVTGVNETTATINWFKYAQGERCDRSRVVWKDRPEEEFSRCEIERWVGNSELARDTLRMEFFADVPFLKNAYIVDTPGTRAVIDAHEETVQDFIAEKSATDKAESETQQQSNRADAIIYVFPPVARETDEELLRSFEQGSRIPNAAPYNSVAVVHKWETINTPDPFEEVQRKVTQIKKVFNAYVAEVLPVSAPMGWACEHFDDTFWKTTFQLGSLPTEIIKGLLLTDKRFLAEMPTCPVPADERKQLREQYPLPWPTLKFIINRVALESLQTTDELKARILEISGIGQLRAMLDQRFFSRSKMIRRFGILAKTLPVCNEGAIILRNHKIRSTRLIDNARKALNDPTGTNIPVVIREYIEETHSIFQSDLATASTTLRDLEELFQPVKDAFEEMNGDIRYIDRLDLLDRFGWSAEWKSKLARLFGLIGPELENRISGFFPERVTNDPVNNDKAAAIRYLEESLSELIRLQSETTGEGKSLLDHARERLGAILDQLEG